MHAHGSSRQQAGAAAARRERRVFFSGSVLGTPVFFVDLSAFSLDPLRCKAF